MPVCPQGHESSTDDFCDLCGTPMQVVPVDPADGPSRPSHRTELVSAAAAQPAGEPCPVCRALRAPDAAFCEACGHRFGTDSAAPAAWIVEVQADRDYFDRSAPEGVGFPAEPHSTTLRLDAAAVVVGRRREGRADVECAIDDPGVSRVHAKFVRDADGSYAIVDQGSTNGTRLNGDTVPIPVDEPVPLVDGDRIHVGAWTTITLRRR
jgi:FHA domain/Double zinc ribbon